MLFQCLRWQKILYSDILNYFWYDLFIGDTDKKCFNPFQRYLLEPWTE